MSSRASVASSRQTNTFTPQTQENALNSNALVALESLRTRSSNTRDDSLQATLDKAAQLLKDVVGDINDRASEDRQRRLNKLEKLKRNGEAEPGDDKHKFEEFQKRVETLTNTMDESVRKVVDDQMWARNVPDSLKHVVGKSKEVEERERRRKEREENSEGDEEVDEVIQPGPGETASALLHAAQSTAESEWSAQTLTERYAENETYSEFYKVRWDAQNHSENPPPLLHHTMWFAAQEGRATQRPTRGTQRQRDADDEEMQDNSGDPVDDQDTEIQILSENRSCKCPLTQGFFEEPVTSTRCSHSYEKSAVLGFIRNSERTLPLSDEQDADLNERYPRGSRGRPQAEAQMKAKQPKVARCPEGGCEMQLLEKDLRDDAVMLRMTKRAREAEKRKEGAVNDDEDDSEDDPLPGTQRRRREVHAIGSSPVSGRRRTLVKPEREVSIVPNSQRRGGRGRGQVVDVEDDDDDDDEDEEMED